MELKIESESFIKTKKLINESLNDLRNVIEEFLPTVSKYWN